MKALVLAALVVGSPCPPNERVPQSIRSDLAIVEQLINEDKLTEALRIYNRVKRRRHAYLTRVLTCKDRTL